MPRQLIVLMLVISSLFITSCANTKKNQFDNLNEADLYQQARSSMVDHKFSRAIEAYTALETRFPFGQYAEQAQLETVSAHYQAYEYDEAVASANRFIRLHPQHPDVDYAYYYKGLANFDANRSIFDRFFELDMSKRDPGAARGAFDNFAELVTKYPNSKYAADSRARMIYLRNILARNEVHVADYYLKRGAYAAAGNRGRYVVEHYQETSAVPDGLAIMVQSYRLMDMPELANSSLEVLRKNYPDHISLDKNGNFKDSYTLQEAERVAAQSGEPGYKLKKKDHKETVE